MTALSDYDPQTHDPKPVLLVAPWRTEKRARGFIGSHGGTYISGHFDEVYSDSRKDHVVIERGHPVQDDFEAHLMYVEIDESYDCYDEIHRQWSDAQ